jgi:hypothetical protein
MSTIYSVGDADNTKSIREKLMSHKNPNTGEAFFTPAVGTIAHALLCLCYAMHEYIGYCL